MKWTENEMRNNQRTTTTNKKEAAEWRNAAHTSHTQFDARAQKLNQIQATESVCVFLFPVSLHSTIRFRISTFIFFDLGKKISRSHCVRIHLLSTFTIGRFDWTTISIKRMKIVPLNAHHLIFAGTTDWRQRQRQRTSTKRTQLMEVRQSMNYDAEAKWNWQRAKHSRMTK